MRTSRAVLALLLLSLTKPAAADHCYVDIETLYGWCQPYEVGSSENIGARCEGYLDAIADILVDGSPIHGHRACIPDHVHLTDLRDVVIKALKHAPRTNTKNAHAWAAKAISEAFPC